MYFGRHLSLLVERSVLPSNLSARCPHSAKTEAPNQKKGILDFA